MILFNGTPVKKVDEHKHLGRVLDSKLSFAAHKKAAISKSRKSIGLLKYLSKYLPRHTSSMFDLTWIMGMFFTISLLKYVNLLET